jgi:uncharacterized membrane protein YjjB (DUF3815 family)
MKSWIAAWIFLFATGVLIAIVVNKEERRKSFSVALLMMGVMVISGLLVVYR